MNLQRLALVAVFFALPACSKLSPDADGRSSVAASAAPAASPPETTKAVVATPTATVAVQAVPSSSGTSSTTVVNGNRAIKVQNGPNGLATDFAGPHGSGTVKVQTGPGGVKVQNNGTTVVVPAGAVPGLPQ